MENNNTIVSNKILYNNSIENLSNIADNQNKEEVISSDEEEVVSHKMVYNYMKGLSKRIDAQDVRNNLTLTEVARLNKKFDDQDKKIEEFKFELQSELKRDRDHNNTRFNNQDARFNIQDRKINSYIR